MTQLRIEPYEIPSADLGAENPLPNFRWAQADQDVKCDASVPEEDRRYLGWRTAFRVLPYRMQDGYNRVKRARAFQAAVLENEFLRATFLPELGGRLWSLIHKPSGRELLERNPVFQPANLALRNAWFSGGIEWNTCHLGHYYLTCAPVFAARVTGTRGEPVLRLYEWDRVKCFPWQIDFHLPPGSPYLFSRVRLVNPHEHEIPMYWWTNIAVPERPDIRTLVPADTAIRGTNEGFSLVRVPHISYPEQPEPVDFTYVTRLPRAQEFFFRIPDQQRHWVASLDGSGRGLVQASTARLRGRKMFCWGTFSGSHRWQDYLAQPGSRYLEIQAGLARTQVESVPMPTLAQWTWTEAFGLLEIDPSEAHSPDWGVAWRAGEAALDASLPQARLDERDGEFAVVTTRRPDEILARGAGWGALERRRLATQKQPDRIPPELIFDVMSVEQQPWLELLEKGVLPERDRAADPSPWMVQPEWRAMLEQSVRSGRGAHWLAWLHLGVMRLEAGDPEGARQAWEQSLKLRRTGWGLRNLASLESYGSEGKGQLALCSQGIAPEKSLRACQLLRQAWEAGPRIAALAVEYARMLLEAKQYQQLCDFARSAPEEIKRNERIQLLWARARLELGQLDGIEALFKQDFATIREGEVALTDVWFEYHARKTAAAEKIPLDDELRKRMRRDCPPPREIDFRMGVEK